MTGSSALVINHRVLLAGTKAHSAIGSKTLYIANRPGAVTMKTDDDLRIEAENERMKLAGYIAYRPGSVPERNAGHALFDQNGIPERAKVQSTLKSNNGAIICSVVSVRREDAEALGLSQRQSWERLIRSSWNKYIESMGVIAPEDIGYVAAMHINDTSYHCHIFTYDKSSSFNSLLPKKEMVKAREEFLAMALRQQTQAVSLDMRQAREALIAQVKSSLSEDQKKLIADNLPEKGSLKYAVLAKTSPRAKESVDRVLRDVLSGSKEMQAELERFEKASEKQALIKCAGQTQKEALLGSVRQDLHTRMANAAISATRAEPQEEFPEFKPTVFEKTEPPTPKERLHAQMASEEIGSFLTQKQQQRLARALTEGTADKVPEEIRRVPLIKELIQGDREAKEGFSQRLQQLKSSLAGIGERLRTSLRESHERSPRDEIRLVGQAVSDALSRLKSFVTKSEVPEQSPKPTLTNKEMKIK